MIVKTTPKRPGFFLNIVVLFAVLLVPLVARAQNEVAIGSAVTKSNAILWLNGNGSQGLLLPVVTNKSAVTNPEKGMFVYDDSDNKVWYRNATDWVEAGGGASGGGTVTSVTGTGPVAVTNSTTTPTISISDGGITNVQLANDAINSSKIQDATITGADILNATITVDKLAPSGALSGQVLKWNGTNWIPQNDEVGGGAVPTLSNGQLLVGNGTSNSAVALSGDATLSGGVLTITNGVISGGKIATATITNTNIAPAAAIEVTKLANGANGQVLTTVAGVPTWSAGSAGTVTSVAAGTGLTGGPITSTGTLSVDVGTTANKVVQLDGTSRLPAVDGSQLINLNASNVSVGVLPLNRITPGTAGDVLTTVAGVPTWQAPVTGVTTLDGLTDAIVAAPASGQLLVNDGAGQFRNVSMSGDAAISNTGALTIANGAISGGVGGKITDGTITTADLAPGAVSGGVGGIIIDATVTNADISTTAAIAVTKVAAGTNGDVLTTVAGVPTWQAPAASSDAQDLTLAGSTLSLVNDPTPVVLGGLSILNSVTTAEITNGTIIAADLAAGSVSGGAGGIITDGTITTADITDATLTNADISGAAAIAVTKVAAGADGQVLTSVGGVPTWQAPAASADAQDLTLSGSTLSLVNDPTPVVLGGLSILNSVTTAEITNGTIIAADLAAGSVSGGAGGVLTDASVTNADISTTAAIAVTKVAAGANGNVLTTVAGVPTWAAPVTGATTLDGLTDATVAAPASGQILVNNGAGQFVNVNMSGDAGISNTGALTIANGAVSGGVGGKITDGTIAAADLAAGSVSGGAGGIITDGTVTTADITDATVTNADISGSAAIAVTKVAAGANGNVLTTVAGVPTWAAPVTGATTLDGLTDATVAAPASGQILVNNGAGQFVNVDMSGDAGISNTGALTIANGAVSGGVGGKITDGTIAAADLAAGSVSGGAGGILTDASVTNADISTTAAIAVTKVAAGANGNVLTTVAGVPTWAAPVTGATTLDGLTDATVAAPASGQILVNNGAGQFVNVDMSGDAGISNTGTLTIANGAISGGVGGKITDGTIAAADLAAGSVSGGAGGIITDGTVTTADITDATVTNADISGSAAIAVTKVAAGANGNVLTTVAGVPTWAAPVTGATTLDGLTDATVAAPASGQILVNNGAGQFVNVAMSGDATLSNTGVLTIANGAISGGAGGKITDATITAADLAAGSVSGGAGGIITDGTVTTADITDGTVTNADISGAAAIAVAKVAAGANGNVLTTVAGVPTWAAPAGGFSALDNVPKGNGTTLVGSSIYDVGGLVGINTSGPLHNMDVYGSLYQTAGDSYFNQSLDNSNGNMAIGGTTFSNIKLNVETDQDYGLYVLNTTGFAAGYFEGYVGVDGDLDVVGNLSKGSGTFKIDHPLDPQNKILYHSFVESPDMMNVYNGNIVTDGQGEVTVSLPAYFEALNKDFRYQLTVIGTFAQAIVYRKIVNNTFVIKTDKPNVEVSWQVTGIRKDPYAEKNRIVPEVAKTGDEIGKYLYPEAYGISAKTGGTAQQQRPKPPAKQKSVVQKPVIQKPTVQKP